MDSPSRLYREESVLINDVPMLLLDGAAYPLSAGAVSHLGENAGLQSSWDQELAANPLGYHTIKFTPWKMGR